MRTVGIILTVTGLLTTAIPRTGLNVSLVIVGVALILLSRVTAHPGKK